MTGQKGKILEMLRISPRPNYAFPAVGILKYTNRISELNALGYDIRCTHQKGGVFLYTLHEPGQLSFPMVGTG